MYTRRYLLYAGTAAATLIIARLTRPHAATAESRTYEVTHSDEEWRKLLTPEQYHVLRHESMRWTRARIALSACSAPRCRAIAAAAILVTCSPTGRNRPGCATA